MDRNVMLFQTLDDFVCHLRIALTLEAPFFARRKSPSGLNFLTDEHPFGQTSS